jgi:hypothetical protein
MRRETARGRDGAMQWMLFDLLMTSASAWTAFGIEAFASDREERKTKTPRRQRYEYMYKGNKRTKASKEKHQSLQR